MKSSDERDQAIERLLRRSTVMPADDDVGASCPDPETLAAWADGGLSGDALEVARSHVADCSRCQALVGTLARIVPATEPQRASRGWRPWLVPLGAAAAAVAAIALWVAVPRDSRVQRQTSEVQRQAMETASPSAEAVDAAPTGSDASNAGKNGVAPGIQSGPPAGGLLSETVPLEARKAAPPPVSPPPPDATTPGAAVGAAAAARPGAGNAVDPAATGKSVAGLAEIAGVEIRSPDPAIRWRIAGSIVQRSTNGGSTWQEVATGFTGQLTAGAAPSTSVCWLVGRGGFMLLATATNNGVSWRRVAFPEPTDLLAVRATDARTATVTSVDGRTFTTTDGGATWVRSTPQEF